MTTPTELDADYFTKKLQLVIRDIRNYTPDELSRELGRLSETASPAFRGAVEAESDAERMKQPAVGTVEEVATGNDVFDIIEWSGEPVPYGTMLYAQPFPSTEQLQREVNDLSSKVCDQCDGDGWNYNAVEGQVPCVCMTEAEPYQLLEQRVKELEDALRLPLTYIKGSYPASSPIVQSLDKALANTQGDSK